MHLGIHLVDALSIIDFSPSYFIHKEEWVYKKPAACKICGRHILNVWRLMISKLILMGYTFENVAYSLLLALFT